LLISSEFQTYKLDSGEIRSQLSLVYEIPRVVMRRNHIQTNDSTTKKLSAPWQFVSTEAVRSYKKRYRMVKDSGFSVDEYK